MDQYLGRGTARGKGRANLLDAATPPTKPGDQPQRSTVSQPTLMGRGAGMSLSRPESSSEPRHDRPTVFKPTFKPVGGSLEATCGLPPPLPKAIQPKFKPVGGSLYSNEPSSAPLTKAAVKPDGDSFESITESSKSVRPPTLKPLGRSLDSDSPTATLLSRAAQPTIRPVGSSLASAIKASTPKTLRPIRQPGEGSLETTSKGAPTKLVKSSQPTIGMSSMSRLIQSTLKPSSSSLETASKPTFGIAKSLRPSILKPAGGSLEDGDEAAARMPKAMSMLAARGGISMQMPKPSRLMGTSIRGDSSLAASRSISSTLQPPMATALQSLRSPFQQALGTQPRSQPLGDLLQPSNGISRPNGVSKQFSNGSQHPKEASEIQSRVQQEEPRPRAGHRGGQRGETREDVYPNGKGYSNGKLAVQASTEYGVVKLPGPPLGDSKKGMGGKEVTLVSNYFQLVSRPDWHVYQYHVEFNPDLDSSSLRRALLKDHKAVLGPYYVFDGMSDVKTMFKLADNPTIVVSRTRRDDKEISIILKLTNELASNHPDIKRLYNTQMKKNLGNMGFQRLGRNYFDVKNGKKFGFFNLELLVGVKTPIGEHDCGILMAVDTIHKFLRTETVLNVISGIKERSREVNFKGPPENSKYADLCKCELVGQIIMTRYNNRTYKIEEISWSSNPRHTFKTKKGDELSYMDYYKNQYDIVIKDVFQPLIICESKDKEILASREKKLVNLIPELCVMTGLTEKMRTNFKMMRELANYTRLDPKARVDNLNNFMKSMDSSEQVKDQMKHWNLEFSNKLIEFKGRTLDPEEIFQYRTSYFYNAIDDNFSKSMRNKELLEPRPFDKWAIVFAKDEIEIVHNFVKKLNEVAPPMGIEFCQPTRVPVTNDRPQHLTEAIRGRCVDMNMVVVILQSNKKDSYDAVKRLLCVDMGIPSQVVVSKTLQKANQLMSVSTKVAIQMDCKLGAEPWALEIPAKSFMVIGYDTYHDAGNKKKSYGAFVASLNKQFTRWYSQAVEHDINAAQEINANIKILGQIALKRYTTINKQLPKIVFYYRDGVGEGQYQQVLDKEVNCFKQAWNSITDQPLRLVFVIVTKKINTRFFRKSFSGSYDNPPAGTIVDNTVTKPERYDFFLVSQSVKQGTVSPTSYLVLEDSALVKPKIVQQLSYKLTHLYFNWPGTISVPAPCQYAHKLAFLAGQSLHTQNIHENLKDALFYL